MQYHWKLTAPATPSPTVDALFALAKARLATALEVKFAEFPAAIIEAHGKDLMVSAEPSRTGTPAPGAGASSSSSASTPAASSTAKSVSKKEAKVNTAKVTVDATFMAAADDLFSILTDEMRIPQWTRAPAKVRRTHILLVSLASSIRGR